MRRFSYVLIVCSCLFLLTAGYYFSYQLGNSGTSEIQPSQLRETEQILQPSYLVRIVNGKVVIQHPDGSVYEATEISEESLPMSVRAELTSGTLQFSRKLFQLKKYWNFLRWCGTMI